jgi:pimeloyl-ACP methyl ester carboxylesterase
VVVLLHGLWLQGREFALLRRRLQNSCGFDVEVFRYASVTATMAQITGELHQFVAARAPRELHLVGHSLGGLVAYRFLERFPGQPPGRVVFLGTPAVASRAANAVSRMAWARALLGRPIAEELLSARQREWSMPRELGIIAGTLALGLGQLFVRFEEENDGSVAVSETRLPGATDFIAVPVSHFGMLLSARVASETGRFLVNGHFSLRAAP